MFWDECYSSDKYAYGTEPNDFLASVASRIPQGGRVLCVAEGEGRNAVWLAGRGHEVTAVDSSATGLRKAAKLAAERGVRIVTECADLAEYEIKPNGYDCIVAIFCHLPPSLREDVHRRCAAALRPGGVMVIEAYTPRQIGRGTGGPPDAALMMTEEVLRSDFEGLDLEILRECDRDVSEGRYHTGLGSVVQMVARRSPVTVLSTSEMPLLPITSSETIRMCRSLPLRTDDVFICSYPKSGTTWMQHIVLSLLMRHRLNDAEADDLREPLDYDHVSDYAPFYEVDQHWDAESRELIYSIKTNHTSLGRRVFNTHLRWDMLPGGENGESVPSGGGKAKFIYLVRSPLDVCVSFFYHLSHQQEGRYEGTFESFFEEWIDGKIAFGSWVDHLLSFAPAFKDPGAGRDLLLITYEEMLADLRDVVDKLVAFLSIDVTPGQIDDMLPTFSFSRMKSDLNKFQPRSVTWKNDFKFLRKGVSGDSLSVVTDAQRAALKDWVAREKFENKLKQVLADKPEVLDKLLALCNGE